jgi:hypothetical protein
MNISSSWSRGDAVRAPLRTGGGRNRYAQQHARLEGDRRTATSRAVDPVGDRTCRGEPDQAGLGSSVNKKNGRSNPAEVIKERMPERRLGIGLIAHEPQTRIEQRGVQFLHVGGADDVLMRSGRRKAPSSSSAEPTTAAGRKFLPTGPS